MFIQREEEHMLEKLPPEVQQAVLAMIGLLPTALLGRALWHRRQVRLGQRKFWGWDLVWEVPTAVLCAIVGGGMASALSLDPMATHAVVGLVGWLGPRGTEVALARLMNRYTPSSAIKQEKNHGQDC